MAGTSNGAGYLYCEKGSDKSRIMDRGTHEWKGARESRGALKKDMYQFINKKQEVTNLGTIEGGILPHSRHYV